MVLLLLEVIPVLHLVQELSLSIIATGRAAPAASSRPALPFATIGRGRRHGSSLFSWNLLLRLLLILDPTFLHHGRGRRGRAVRRGRRAGGASLVFVLRVVLLLVVIRRRSIRADSSLRAAKLVTRLSSAVAIPTDDPLAEFHASRGRAAILAAAHRLAVIGSQ